jgi:diguanylate cyclase (GGDEF)-like protein/putative nucleotidyltransferase with HDIG domain
MLKGRAFMSAALTADKEGVNTRGRAGRPLTDLIARLSLARFRRDVIERLSRHDVRWRALGALFIAGGVLAGGSLLLPVDRDSEVLAIGLVCLTAVVTGVILVWAAGKLPASDLWLGLVLAFGTVLITLGVVFNRSIASPYALLYVWVGFDGFFFLGRRAAFANLGWVGINYALALIFASVHGQAEVGRWVMVIGTVGVIGVLADILRSRSEVLINRLSEVARTDSLTGLLNRRGFEERLEEELHRAGRNGGSVSLVVGDLDHFKLVNDRFGHHVGDDALRKFSQLVIENKRVVDGAGRIGGEEFALILPDTDSAGGHVLAERLRRSVRDALVEYGLPLSVSLGIASYPRHGQTGDELLRCADQAMYLAKRLGRDRSVIYSSEVSQSLEGEPGEALQKIEHVPAVLILAETLDLRDTGTAMHSQTVGRYAEMIAQALGLSEERVKRIRLAGLLHDIGKIGLPDPILRKPGALDPLEWEEIKKHPELGARILAGANLDDISGWVLAHHERPDGTGYPIGLSSDQIPLEAKILAVADSFEAMTAERVYSPPMPVEIAIGELLLHSGEQFDAEVVEVFIAQLATALGKETLAAAIR